MDHRLNIFLTVAEQHSFSKTADKLYITQSAVSQAIKSLEKEYGMELLERSNKYIGLTKAGKILYYHGKEIMEQYALVDKFIEDIHTTASGALWIGASYTFGEYSLPKMMSEFKTNYPNIKPKITIKNTHRIIEQLLRRELDIGIINGRIQHPNLLIKPFALDEMVVIVPINHPLGCEKVVTTEELESETWVIRESGSGTRELTDHMFQQTGIHPKEIMEFGSPQIIKESVEVGLGISYISKGAIRKELALGTLCALNIKGFDSTQLFFYATRDTQIQTKAAELFITFLEKTHAEV
ncbi:transcriptional regulator [Bacillus sp. FJAT-18017]|uniref:LysR family transcriptional regulator n=1 Tax=Bacillus sp. FJAT-18017 TaxID=1705566 RepID=UPI0006AF0077|nr:LysR family transcriptional regulator [Bacillus sp. FJAT-18017]ALC91553.1 transcriptional regulator [Bacillus sp. FJAT-18017]